MIKNNFKFLFLTIIIVICFANNLPAMHNPTEPKIEDAFIKEFVDKMKSDKINYDGKTLTLYASSSLYEYIVAIFDLVIFTSLLGKSLDNNDKGIRLVCGSIFLILDLMALYLLYKNLHYDRSKVPFLIMNDSEIKFWNGKSIEWKDFDQASSFSISRGNFSKEYYLFKFYDKFSNVLFEIKDQNGNSPISADNLFSILEHYHNKAHSIPKDELKEFILKTVREAASNEIAKPV